MTPEIGPYLVQYKIRLNDGNGDSEESVRAGAYGYTVDEALAKATQSYLTFFEHMKES
jgi:hypothetical protein